MLMLIFFLTEHFVVIAQFIEYFILLLAAEKKKWKSKTFSFMRTKYLAKCHQLKLLGILPLFVDNEKILKEIFRKIIF